VTAGRARHIGRLLVVLVWCGFVQAQSTWTVQTVAYRDLRDANAEVAYLRSLGLPAYTEFTMTNGLQYVRVRVGCHAERDAAEAWASLLQTGVTREAVAVPTDARPPDHVPCVATEVGFLKPSTWALVSTADELPTFRVEVAGHVAYLRHDGDAWRLWQTLPPASAFAPRLPVDQQVRVGSVSGQPVARTAEAGVLCPGRLIATAGAVAIVDRGDAVVACRVATAYP